MNCGSATWSQTFSYDAWGNLSKSGTQSFGATYNAENQISTNINFTPNYDLDGNLLDDPVSASRSVNTFDAEGHAVRLEGMNVTYDALGRAAEVAEPSGPEEFVYGPGGDKVAVMSGPGLARADVPLPGGGKAVYNAGGLAFYRHADWLGTSRLASTPARGVYAEAAYAPYGETYSTSGVPAYSFTGQTADVNGGQYDFLLREYNPIQGRWYTPDPAGRAAVNPNNPQSWNRYAYVLNNPLRYTDPLGLRPCNNAKLDKPDDDKTQVGGPHEDNAAGGEADGPGDCAPAPCTDYFLDGVELGCGGLGQAAAMSGSISGAYVCQWSDCQGAFAQIDSYGNPITYRYLPPDHCTPGGPDAFSCTMSIAGLQGPQVAPALAGCGWDIACHAFVGFGNLFINGKPSGAVELGGALAVGAAAGAWETAAPALADGASSADSWAANVALPAAVNAGRYLVTNPDLLIALAECGSEFIPGENPPPTSLLGLRCWGVSKGLRALGVTW